MLGLVHRLFLPMFILCVPLSAGEVNGEEVLLKKISKGFSSVAKRAIPAVVYIESHGVSKPRAPKIRRPRQRPSQDPFEYFHEEFFNRFFNLPSPEQSQQKKPEIVRGSGFIFSSDGYIVTNNHVVANAEKVMVTLNGGQKMTAKVIGTDPKTDLAVIKVEANDLPTVTFGSSKDLQVGDWAIAVGNPFGLEATVTVGVVSAKGRSQLNITDFEDFIQTDAAINPGNSGGPLLNVDAEVIGINTAIVSGSGGYMGIGFAIPSSMASNIIQQLIDDGSVTRGFLGVTLQPIDSDLATFYKLKKVQGALVTDVVKGSPAQIAGLQQEDIILNYNDNPVESLASFRNAVSLMPPGSKLVLKVQRSGKMQVIKVTVSSLPDDIQPVSTTDAARLGIEVQNLTPDVAAELGFDTEQGVIISKVHPNSAAAEALLRRGTLIKAVNRKKVTNIKEFNEALKEIPSGGTVLLLVRQGQIQRFVALKPDKQRG